MPTSEAITRRIPLLAIIAVTAAAFFTLLYATATWGISIKEDAAIYIQAAQRIQKGMDWDLTQYPPLYPVLLWVGSLFSHDIASGARWLHAILFAASTLLVALLLKRTVPGATWLPLLGAILFACSFDMLGVYLAAWSEALFIFFTYSALFLLALYLSRARWLLLVLAGSLTALALLTRYVGLSVVATGGIALLCFSSRSWRQKIIDCIVFGIISVLPLALWLVILQTRLGNATNRSLFFRLPDAGNVAMGVSYVLRWVLPQRLVEALPFAAQALLSGVVLFGAIALYRMAVSGRRKLAAEDLKLPAILVIYVLVYLLFVFASATLFDRAIRFNLRLMSPLFVAALILALCAIYMILSVKKLVRWQRLALVVVALVYVGSYLIRSVPLAISEHQEGSGYVSLKWRSSEGMRVIRDTPPQVPIYSNMPNVVYFAERQVNELPFRYSSTSLQPRAAFDSELQAMLDALRTKQALIVYFDGNTDNDPLMVSPAKDLIGEMQVPLVAARVADATIYKAP